MEHVPQPKEFEDWTVEDHVKFRMFSDHCPMCKYKYEYGVLQNLIVTANNTDDESVKGSLFPLVQNKQHQLVELGLFIASSVDQANAEAFNHQMN